MRTEAPPFTRAEVAAFIGKMRSGEPIPGLGEPCLECFGSGHVEKIDRDGRSVQRRCTGCKSKWR